MGKKKAVLIGCNYPGTDSELKGCVNDVANMHSQLVDRFGFTLEDMEVLLDMIPTPSQTRLVDLSFTVSNGKNICAALERLVTSASPGDVLFIHYSGHGSRIPNDSDVTGYDECIMPTDLGFITVKARMVKLVETVHQDYKLFCFNSFHADDYFKDLVSMVPDGCRLTIVSDSCQSGGLIDGVKEQIGDSTKGIRELELAVDDTQQEAIEQGNEEQVEKRKAKFISISTLIDMLKQKTGKDNIDVSKVRETLSDMHGKDLSSKELGKQNVSEPKQGEEALADTLGRQKLDETEEEVPGNGILLSGCQTYQCSIDSQEGGEAHGAFTNAILTVLAESKGSVSNYELITKVRETLESQGYPQKPGLYCSDEHAHAPFIC